MQETRDWTLTWTGTQRPDSALRAIQALTLSMFFSIFSFPLLMSSSVSLLFFFSLFALLLIY